MKVYIKDYYLSNEISQSARIATHTTKLKEGLAALGMQSEEHHNSSSIYFGTDAPKNTTESKGHPLFSCHLGSAIYAGSTWGYTNSQSSGTPVNRSLLWTVDEVKYCLLSTDNTNGFAMVQDYGDKYSDYMANNNLKVVINARDYGGEFAPDKQGKYRTIICHDATTHMFAVGILRVDDGKSLMMSHSGVKSFVSPSSTDIIFSPCANKVMPRTGISDIDSVSFTVINQLSNYNAIIDPQSKKDTLRNTYYNQKPLIGLDQFGLVAEANYWKSTIPTLLAGTIIAINNEDYLTLRDGYYIKLGADGDYEKL